MSNEPKRRMTSFRLDEKTRDALKKKADEMGESKSNTIGIMLGTIPQSAFSYQDKSSDGKRVTR